MQQTVEGIMMTTKKGARMGGLGRLSDFGKTSQPEPPLIPESISQPEAKVRAAQDKLVTINIKVTRAQHNWLSDTARMVRDNNDTPVTPSERVFPQHLIGIAIDLLQQSDVDWSQVRKVGDLRQRLKL